MNELKIEFDTGVGDMKAERPELPRAEHPRPQLMRDAWESLNGMWGFCS